MTYFPKVLGIGCIWVAGALGDSNKSMELVFAHSYIHAFGQ